MSDRIDVPALQQLSEVIQLLGPIDRDEADTWSGKRANGRTSVLLPTRIRILDEQENPQGPALTARSRDVSERGIGLVIPYPIDLLKHYQVELFTEMGTWSGRMKAMHCTQTVGGYKVGLESLDAPPPPPLRQPATSLEPQEVCEGEPFTLEQAQEEVRRALRGYYRARRSLGVFGVNLEDEINRVIKALPPSDDCEIQVEPHRREYRHDVQGQVYLLMLAEGKPQLLAADIADISAGGARLVVPADEAEAVPAEVGTAAGAETPAVIGLWTQSGTVWLPASVTHRENAENGAVSIGVQFGMVRGWQAFC